MLAGEARGRGKSQESTQCSPTASTAVTGTSLFSPFSVCSPDQGSAETGIWVPSSCQEKPRRGRSPGVAQGTRTGRDRGRLLLDTQGTQTAFAKQETLNKALGLPL